MYTYIRSKTLHEGIKNAMLYLCSHGVETIGENQDREDILKEIQLVLDVESVNDVKILKAMPSDMETMVDYVLEMVEGTRDNDTKFGYTYHALFKDNIPYVVNELKRNPNTRRATLIVADGQSMRLSHPPCLQRIHFTIKDNKLNTTAQFRSNDGVNAIVMNSFAIIELARNIANQVGIKELGSYTHMADSFHAYSKDWNTLNGYCDMFFSRDINDCAYSYKYYETVFNDVADKIRNKYTYRN